MSASGLDGRYLGQDWLKQFMSSPNRAGHYLICFNSGDWNAATGAHVASFHNPLWPKARDRAPNTARI